MSMTAEPTGWVAAAAIALLLSALACGPVHAHEDLTKVPIFSQSPKELDCESWESLRLRRTARTDVVEAWAFGYATAYVSSHAKPPGLSFTKEQLLPLIDAECRPELHNNYIWAAVEAALKPVLAQAAQQ
jgi:hypothetical protein